MKRSAAGSKKIESESLPLLPPRFDDFGVIDLARDNPHRSFRFASVRPAQSVLVEGAVASGSLPDGEEPVSAPACPLVHCFQYRSTALLAGKVRVKPCWRSFTSVGGEPVICSSWLANRAEIAWRIVPLCRRSLASLLARGALTRTPVPTCCEADAAVAVEAGDSPPVSSRGDFWRRKICRRSRTRPPAMFPSEHADFLAAVRAVGWWVGRRPRRWSAGGLHPARSCWAGKLLSICSLVSASYRRRSARAGCGSKRRRPGCGWCRS